MDYYERQLKTPLFDAVVNYAKKKKISFHTPGHKHGDGISKRFRDFVGARIFDIDLTLLEEVDSLQDPKTVIKDAQKLAAEAYGTDYSFFLVNGTTIGNHAMILSVCLPGDKIIIPRNAHKSVIAGVIISGAIPIYVYPKVDKDLGIICNVTPTQIEEKIKEHPDVKAILITNPTYNGITTDIREIVRIAHQYKKILLVDEAHGPHLKFHPDLPTSAMEGGADICVQSTHKIISGMTQASMLHARRTIDILKLKRILQLLHTTSPSYILLASLDVARMQMATSGSEILSRVIDLAEETRKHINNLGLRCFGKEITGKEGIFGLDVTKLTIDTRNIGNTGYEVSRLLNKKYGIQVEFATPSNLLAIVSLGNTKNDIYKLTRALKDIKKNFKINENIVKALPDIGFPEFASEVVLTPREASFSVTKKVSFKDSIGLICAEIVSPYPPGIPLLVPGERITKEAYNYLHLLKELGNIINGQDDKSLQTIKVVCETRHEVNGLAQETFDFNKIIELKRQ
ncbi:MAG: aminotransferase class I/II-fold pyridoxal phosphate-dependent enzyme [Candidatus Firestonebacteria bacterium]